MADAWDADPSASLARRLGSAPDKLGVSRIKGRCPDIWELDNGDIAVIGRDLTTLYEGRLPPGVSVTGDERLVIIPRITLVSAKADIPDV